MKVTIIRKIFLHNVELDIPEEPTQEQLNSAIEEYLKNDEIEDPYHINWDDTDYLGNERIEVYDDYTGLEVYNSLENS